ncbi:MAG: hypothetical protein A2901_03575 [Elusimicrobia bacterium RIFCSPLOWO2_01_FULL_54_10]|nr:MAG: hypothetical protein A2901_03575 [Elusimicrobia bacterium RIFCSPLOWO2_01_FULL_54_10]
MNPAWISLAALFTVILISSFSRTNVGVLALGFAWLIGHYVSGMPVSRIAAGFPAGLFLLLLGVTVLFSSVKVNGTLDRLAAAAIGLVRGHRALVPFIFFLLAAVFSAIGPGNIGATALLAPLAMEIAGRMKISAFLTTVMVVAGANAGTFSPFASTGLIAGGLAAKSGIEMNPWSQIFFPNILAQGFIAFSSYMIFGGVRLWRPHPHDPAPAPAVSQANWTWTHWLSVGAIGALVLGVTYFKTDVGFLALILAALLSFMSPGEHRKTIAGVPWDAIVMVCGVSTLVSVLEATGGMQLFTELLAKISNASNVTGVIAFVAGILSVFSSSSGVVLPAFIPTVPGLAALLPGADSAAIISSINVGSHVVDVSPLSTLGALCLASAGAHEDKNKLFRNLMIYGLSLSLFGAGVCYLFF